MRLRHRVLLLLAALLAGAVGALAVVAVRLLHEVGAASDVGTATAAASRVLWLGAGAVAALAVGIGGVASRLWIVAPLEALAREVGAGGQEEIDALRQSLAALRRDLERAHIDREGQLGAIESLLERADARLAATDRLAMTGQLALGAAHELGSPLAIAVACVDSLRYSRPADAGDDPAAGYVDRIDDALGRIDAILRELNAFGLQERAATADERTQVVAVATQTLALARMHKKCRQLDLALVGAEPLAQVAVTLPRRHLEQVLLNLVINAADATERRGRVELRLRLDGERVLLALHDDGEGVPVERQRRVFEPFYTSKPPDIGSGLGLAVSRRLARAVGGELTLAESDLGGACFTLTLPVAPSEAR